MVPHSPEHLEGVDVRQHSYRRPLVKTSESDGSSLTTRTRTGVPSGRRAVS